jgi:cation:H+ antiporter
VSLRAADLLSFAAGLAGLLLGARLLVDGAARLAVRLGISALVVGMTIVAFGTSSPELAVGVRAALADHADIAVGSVVGSNIFNILGVLGLAALLFPIRVAASLVRLEVPLMIGVSVLLLALALDGRIGRIEGVVLAAGIVTYTVFAIRASRRESAEVRAEFDREFASVRARPPLLPQIGLIAVGLPLLVLGSRWLVDGAAGVAADLGVSELVIGLTIVSIGTSAPELATSVVAALRKEPDIAVGNAVGSNLFNILSVIGLSAAVAPGGIAVPETAIRFDIPVMIGVAVACLPIFLTGSLVARWEGALFVGLYAGYVAYLALDALEHPALPAYGAVMLWFVLPLVALTLAWLAVLALRQRRHGASDG